MRWSAASGGDVRSSRQIRSSSSSLRHRRALPGPAEGGGAVRLGVDGSSHPRRALTAPPRRRRFPQACPNERPLLLRTCAAPRVYDVASGQVISEITNRHRAEEFRRFLNTIDKAVPEHLEIHVVLDNSSTHKTPSIQRWLLRHPRFHVHFTPTYSSWLNLVERWFSELTTKWIKRGTHRSVRDLTASIRTWITSWNEDPKPYVWHKSAEEILDSLANYCQRINDSGH